MIARARMGAGAALAMLAVVSQMSPAAAAFRTRAAGHVFRCGERTVEIGRDGTASLSSTADPAVLTATAARWTARGVRLTFPKPDGALFLSEYGATVSLKAGGANTVCVTAQ